MKTKFGILMICLLLVSLFTEAKVKEPAVVSGQSLTELGDYAISPAMEPLTCGNETLTTYELKYSNMDTPVLIGVKKTKKCMNFIIRANNFEVEYVCNKHVFGAKRINKDYQTVPTEVINAMMDNQDLFSQRVITQQPKTEEELLGLIACYLPSLIKDNNLAKLGQQASL